jgi:solute carrier family 35 protein C2
MVSSTSPSQSLIFVLFFAFLFRLEAFSWKLISVIGLITAGVVLMAFNTTAVDLPGAMLVFIASALGGLRWALTHALMIKQELGLTNPFATIFWITPVMAFTLAIVSMIEDFQPDRLLVTLILIIIPGLLAFAMVASEY